MITSVMNSARSQALVFAYIVTCCAVIFMHVYLNPTEVWDMLGYAASVHSYNGLGIAEIHASVLADLRTYSSATTYHDLTASSAYRITMATDPVAFSQQIPFYKIRLLYVMLIDGLNKLGFDLFESMHFLSAGFGSVTLLIVYLGLRNHVLPLLWLFLPVVFFGVTNDMAIVQQGGVDTFALFWLSLTIVCYARGSKLFLPVLALCVLVRTDLVLFAAMMFAVQLLADKSNRIQTVLWGMATVAMYLGVNAWAGNYGWFALIHFVFVTDLIATHPVEYSQIRSFNFQDYWAFLTFPHAWVNSWLWICIGCALASVTSYLWYRKTLSTTLLKQNFSVVQRLNIACIICVAYVVLHYLLFPILLMRFFLATCLFMTMSLFSTFSYIYHVRNIAVEKLSKPEPKHTLLTGIKFTGIEQMPDQTERRSA